MNLSEYNKKNPKLALQSTATQIVEKSPVTIGGSDIFSLTSVSLDQEKYLQTNLVGQEQIEIQFLKPSISKNGAVDWLKFETPITADKSINGNSYGLLQFIVDAKKPYYYDAKTKTYQVVAFFKHKKGGASETKQIMFTKKVE